jgi:hypothetical protein
MKPFHLFFAAALLLGLPACERKKSASGEVKDTVDDVLDRRPGEKVRDAAEEAKDAVKDAGKEVKEAVEDAAK